MNDAELVQQFDAVLYDDISLESQFHQALPLLAHYTTIQTVEKIISAKEVWFSNPLYMNDLEEVRFGLVESEKLLLANVEIAKALSTPQRAAAFFAAYNYFTKEFIEKHLPDTFIFCLSEHDPSDTDGLLSMWRGYGGNGNGAAIVFDTRALGILPQSPLVLAKVLYNTTQERLSWIEGRLASFAAKLVALALPDDKLHLPAYSLFYRFKLFALYSKHKGFDEEREWRVTYNRERDTGGLLDAYLGYFVGPNGVEPKLKFKIEPIQGVTSADLSLTKITDRIILGPSVSSPIAQSTFQRLLRQCGEPLLADKVFASTIPFRTRA
jgi:hypothetical protein